VLKRGNPWEMCVLSGLFLTMTQHGKLSSLWYQFKHSSSVPWCGVTVRTRDLLHTYIKEPGSTWFPPQIFPSLSSGLKIGLSSNVRDLWGGRIVGWRAAASGCSFAATRPNFTFASHRSLCTVICFCLHSAYNKFTHTHIHVYTYTHICTSWWIMYSYFPSLAPKITEGKCDWLGSI